MNPENTCLLLIGFQNDYFSETGVLHSVVAESSQVNHTIANTVQLIEALTSMGKLPLIVATPMAFYADYRELKANLTGILQHIKLLGAFRDDDVGVESIAELRQFGDRIHELPGKQGLNAFVNTGLHPFLVGANTTNLVLAGAVSSVCIDSTARAAYELGFKVVVLSDCTAARTTFEQEYFCRHIFPLYSEVLTYRQLLTRLSP